jgi:hypothetical protein
MMVAPFNNAADRALFEVVLRVAEVPITALSLYASYAHFTNSGGRVTCVSRFHLAHAAFCVAFVVAKIIVVFAVGEGDIFATVTWSKCSPWNILYNVNVALFLLTAYLFFSYWEALHTATHRVETSWGTARKASYVLCGLLWAIGEVNSVAACHSSRPRRISEWAYVAFDLTQFVDSAWTTGFVWMATHQEQRSRLWPFGVIAASFGVATITEILGIVGKDGFTTLTLIFCISIPSFLYLYVMFRRLTFFIAVEDLNLCNNDTEETFGFTSPASSSLNSLLAPLFSSDSYENKLVEAEAGARSSRGSSQRDVKESWVSAEEWSAWRKSNYGLRTLVWKIENDDDDDEEEEGEEELGIAFERAVDSEASVASSLNPASALEQPASTGDSRRVLADLESSLKVANPLTSNLRIESYSDQGTCSVVRIDEDLRPADCVVPLIKAFLASIAVPAAERALQFHTASSIKLVEATMPPPQAEEPSRLIKESIGFEKHWQHEKLKSDSDELTSRFADWIMFLRAVSDHLDPSNVAENVNDAGERSKKATKNEQGIFKPSTEKKVLATSHFPTNCHVHTTAIELNPGGGGNKLKHAHNKRVVKKRLTTITFGAPAAHSMGFNMGGIRQLEAKLEALYKQQAGDVKTTAEAQMRQLELRFAICSRESVVVAQALAGVVSAAVDALTWCIVEHQESLLVQLSQIGLLVHSLSLLSTRGAEYGMIDDFAGALERLSVTIRLVSPSEPRYAASEAASEEPASSRVMLRVVAVERGDKACVGGNASSRRTMCGRVTVCLSVEPAEAYGWVLRTLASSERAVEGGSSEVTTEITVKHALFNLGVNEQQTISNATGTTAMQTDINRRGVEALAAYYELYAGIIRGPRELPTLLARLQSLVEAVVRGRSKDVEMLLLGSHIARLMNGARTTSCKSAKDRTSVFQTLEVARCATSGGIHAPPHESELKPILDELRGPNGVRLQNCELNVGNARYAFNNLQLQALPPMLRPPPATIGARES